MASRQSVDEHLRQAERQWRGLLLLRRLSLSAVVGLLAALLIGVVMYAAWFSTAIVPALLLLMVAAAVLLSALILAMLTLDQRPDVAWLASALERRNEPLLDRLNTLVYLRDQADSPARTLQPLIEQQASQVLRSSPAASPFSRQTTWLHVGAVLVTLLLTVGFYGYFEPWRFVGDPHAGALAASDAEPDLELELGPKAEDAEGDADDPLNAQAWTDVRISEPGRDLRVTRHEVIPVRIEAASNRGLTKIEWFTSLNGGAPEQHALAPPEDPRYASYETQILLEDYNLRTWDVVSYYARATTTEGTTHDSEVYFIEVIPYREELAELPGGEEGEPTQRLGQMTDLVERQQEVIRQTNHAAESQVAGAQSDARTRHLNTLANEESQLQTDLQFLDAALRARMDEDAMAPLGEAIENSQAAMKGAEESLRDGDPRRALQSERNALSSLVELRKALQKVAAENPGVFQSDSDDPMQQLAERQSQQLEQMQARRDQMQQAREFLQNKLEEQRNLQRSVNSRPSKPLAAQARRQLEMQQALEEYAGQNPEPFQNAESEQQQARSAMREAAQAMQQPSPAAKQLAAQAAESLQQLDNALDRQQQRDQLTDAMRLGQMLQQQSEQLQRFEQEPQSVSAGQCQQAGGQAKAAAGQLQELAQRGGPGSPLASRLQEAVGEDGLRELNEAADRLAQSGGAGETKQRAQQLRQRLEPLAEALAANTGQSPSPSATPSASPSASPSATASQSAERPDSTGSGEQANSSSLQPSGHEALERGMRQLESIARREGLQRSTRQSKSQLAREALTNLSRGMMGLYGHNEQTRALMTQVREQLEEPVTPFDRTVIEDLTRQIQLLRREAVVPTPRARQQNGLRDIDLEGVSPEYRDWARKYFEELSRRPTP